MYIHSITEQTQYDLGVAGNENLPPIGGRFMIGTVMIDPVDGMGQPIFKQTMRCEVAAIGGCCSLPE